MGNTVGGSVTVTLTPTPGTKKNIEQIPGQSIVNEKRNPRRLITGTTTRAARICPLVASDPTLAQLNRNTQHPCDDGLESPPHPTARAARCRAPSSSAIHASSARSPYEKLCMYSGRWDPETTDVKERLRLGSHPWQGQHVLGVTTYTSPL